MPTTGETKDELGDDRRASRIAFAAAAISPAARLASHLRVCDVPFAAWEQWRRDYEARQLRQEFMDQSAAADAGSTQSQ